LELRIFFLKALVQKEVKETKDLLEAPLAKEQSLKCAPLSHLVMSTLLLLERKARTLREKPLLQMVALVLMVAAVITVVAVGEEQQSLTGILLIPRPFFSLPAEAAGHLKTAKAEQVVGDPSMDRLEETVAGDTKVSVLLPVREELMVNVFTPGK